MISVGTLYLSIIALATAGFLLSYILFKKSQDDDDFFDDDYWEGGANGI